AKSNRSMTVSMRDRSNQVPKLQLTPFPQDRKSALRARDVWHRWQRSSSCHYSWESTAIDFHNVRRASCNNHIEDVRLCVRTCRVQCRREIAGGQSYSSALAPSWFKLLLFLGQMLIRILSAARRKLLAFLHKSGIQRIVALHGGIAPARRRR